MRSKLLAGSRGSSGVPSLIETLSSRSRSTRWPRPVERLAVDVLAPARGPCGRPVRPGERCSSPRPRRYRPRSCPARSRRGPSRSALRRRCRAATSVENCVAALGREPGGRRAGIPARSRPGLRDPASDRLHAPRASKRLPRARRRPHCRPLASGAEHGKALRRSIDVLHLDRLARHPLRQRGGDEGVERAVEHVVGRGRGVRRCAGP